MKLSTRTRYGTRALLELAQRYGEPPVPLKQIAGSQGISLSYLANLVQPLVDARLVQSTRGARGGLRLARAPASISLRDVVDLLEGPIKLVECVESPVECDRSCVCATRDIWSDIGRAINEVLEQTTLADLVDRQKAKVRSSADMYHI